jgi:hypothetical protein
MITPKVGERVFHPVHGEGKVIDYPFYDQTEVNVFFISLNRVIKVENTTLSYTYNGAKKKLLTTNVKFGLRCIEKKIKKY